MAEQKANGFDDWATRAEGELRGKPLDDLTWVSPEGIPIKPLYTEADLDAVEDMDDDVDHLYAEILNYAATLAREEMQTAETKRLEDQIEIANNLEAIGDLIETNLVAQGRQRLARNVVFTEQVRAAGQPLYEAIAAALRDVLKALAEDDRELARDVAGRKEEIKDLARGTTDALAADLLAEDTAGIESFRIEADIINQIRRLAYHVRRIAKVIAA